MNAITDYLGNRESYIVCLDDDRDFLNSLRMSLPAKLGEDQGYCLLFQDNPLETLALVQELVENEEQVALLMTDQMMPEMRGIDFLREARKITPTTMRVLLTGHAGLDSAIHAINDNVLDKYLTKPVNDIEDLAFTLKRLLNEFHLRNTVEIQNQVLRDLYTFSNVLCSRSSTQEILEHTVAFTRDTLKCERISVLLVENEVLVYKAGLGIPKDIQSAVEVPVGKNVSGRVLEARTPMLVTDIAEIPWLSERINADFRSFMSAPVVSAELCLSDVPLGVINVTNKVGNESFTEQELRILSFIANSASIAINNQLNRMKLEQSYFDTVAALIMALEARDTYTKGHSVRVMDYATGIAQQLTLRPNIIKTIQDAAILHDIGKIGIRDDILLKAGALDPEQRDEVRKHPEISGSIVRSISTLQEVGLVVRQHHEHYDGNGYPDGLKGEEIHIGARVLAVADAYDAMTSVRPYRAPLSGPEAQDELKRTAGSQFDPECVLALFEYLEHRPAAEGSNEDGRGQDSWQKYVC